MESVIQLLEAGSSPWRRPWNCEGGGHHVNLLTGARYRGSNPALLTLGLQLRMASRGPRGESAGGGARCRRWALPYWCGFAEARAHGLVPRKGSRAVAVLRPQWVGGSGAPESGGDAMGEDPDPVGADGADPRPTGIRCRPVPVFHVADLLGKSLEAWIETRRAAAARWLRPEPERLAAAEAVLGAWPVPVVHGGDQAAYVPRIDRILLPERAAFHSAASLYATWAHEAIHSTGHPSRLRRDLSGRMGGDGASARACAREELVAELGAVLLGDRLEIGSEVRHHAAHLGHWIELLRESPRLLFRVLSEARQAADLIAPEPGQAPLTAGSEADP